MRRFKRNVTGGLLLLARKPPSCWHDVHLYGHSVVRVHDQLRRWRTVHAITPPTSLGASACTCGGTWCKRMEGSRTVLQLTLRVRDAVPLCTGAVYSSVTSSANSSDKRNMPQPGGHVTASILSTEHVEEIFTSREFDWFKDFIGFITSSLASCLEG